VEQKKGPIEWTRIFLFIFIPLYHLAFISGFFPLIHVYINSHQHRAMSLGSILAFTLLIYPFRTGKPATIRSWYNLLFVLAGVIPCCYIFFYYDLVIEHQALGAATDLEIFLCLALIVALYEGTRRTVGTGMAIIAVGLIGYTLIGSFLPGILHAKSFDVDRVAYQLLLTNEGIFGMPMGVAATIIIAFVIFGQFYQAFGGGQFLSDISASLMGRYTGGAGKVAVLASALMGTITGSTTANIAAVGTFTIPMMVKAGYKPEFAAGVEAVSSNGGQIMPPVMGAVAFIIAEWLGIPYVSVCIAAVVPALLYFAVLYMQIDLEARKGGLVGLPKDQLPVLKHVIKRGWYHLIPVFVLLYCLVYVGYTPEKSSLYAIVSIPILHLIVHKGRIGFKQILSAFETSSKAAPAVVTSCASASIIVCAILLTGLGFRISSLLTVVGGESVILLLLMAALACYALGFGVGSVAGYMIVALLVTPALVKAGVLPLAAHLFVFYWSLTGFLTPPVAVGAFVAAAIAKADPWRTGFVAMRLGVVTFIAPFIFATNPALLLKGEILEVVWVVAACLLSSLYLAIAASGYFRTYVNWYWRTLLIVAAAIVTFSFVTHIFWIMPIGLILGAFPLAYQLYRQPIVFRKVCSGSNTNGGAQ
jgi:TRAP transporter 4TM/12TM fusion protein